VPTEVERLNPGDLVSVQLLSGEGWANHSEPSQAGPHRMSCC
jgi:molybdopterin molybdotransferase